MTGEYPVVQVAVHASFAVLAAVCVFAAAFGFTTGSLAAVAFAVGCAVVAGSCVVVTAVMSVPSVWERRRPLVHRTRLLNGLASGSDEMEGETDG